MPEQSKVAPLMDQRLSIAIELNPKHVHWLIYYQHEIGAPTPEAALMEIFRQYSVMCMDGDIRPAKWEWADDQK